MRLAAILLAGLSLAACRTSSLGACAGDGDCASGASCDLALRVCVSTAAPDGSIPGAPQISNVAISTPAGFTSPDGSVYFDTSGTPLNISATITGPSGVAAGSACLRIAGETGSCAHPGSAGAGDSYSFSLPRPSSSDGTAPLEFTVTAASPSGIVGTSAVQRVYFDGQPPAISIAADSAHYARLLPDGGASPIGVSVTIVDGVGVAAPQLLSGAAALPPASSSGNVYVFQLDPRDAPAGTEGAYGFHVRAVDRLGHDGGADGTRVIDGAPPAVAVQIYKDAPDGGGVTYPAAVPNTGWTGATFVYSDTVHVQGTITDSTGIGAATLRVDGIDLDGGVSRGTARDLGCSPGAFSCPFALDVTLNDAGSELHTGTSTFDAGVAAGNIPAGMLQFTIDARDTAVASDGGASPNAASSVSAARTTRLLWQRTLAGAAVSGMAVHPSGDLIVTMDGGTGNTVYALAADQPATRWGRTLAVTLPADGVIGTPAIGAGDGSSARIYLASGIGDLYAFSPDGGTAWTNQTSSSFFAVGPAVTQVTVGGNVVDAVVVPDGVASPNSKLWRGISATDVTSVASDNRDFHAAPLILGGSVYFATQNGSGSTSHLTKHSIAANGDLSAGTTPTANAGVPWFGLLTDGTSLYAATRPATLGGVLVKTDTSFGAAAWTDTLASGLAGEPTFGIDGKLYGADLASALSAFNPASGAATPFAALSSVGMTPLQGSDGHLYIPRRTSGFSAFDGNQLSWTFTAPTAVLRFATMDCQGHVFVAHGPTVSAFLSDDHGLADTAWPSLRRDARNSGNAGAIKYGIRTAAGCTQ
jgi:hypothetical protein